jgi:hypothetical protein
MTERITDRDGCRPSAAPDDGATAGGPPPGDGAAGRAGAVREGGDDFPAAHSMDTTWFAVDRDGHVAAFDSDETGAVPRAVDEAVGAEEEVLADFEALPVVGRPRLEASALWHPGLAPGARPARWRVDPGWPPDGDAYALLLAGPGVVPDAVRALPGVGVDPVGDFVLVSLVPEAPAAPDGPDARAWAAFVRAVDAGPHLVTARGYFGVADLARRGAFVYQAHSERFYRAEPYGRLFTPQRPLRLDELPGPLRGRLAARPRFDLSFAEAAYVQPAELAPCATWAGGAVYVAADGFTVRPVPGREAAYDAEARALDVAGARQAPFVPVVFDPPPGESTR